MDQPFDPFERKMREAGLPPVAIDTFRHCYEQLRSGRSATLSRDEIGPVEDVPHAGDLSAHRDAGLAALDRTVVLKLNGGLGTSMGMRKAKSLLPVKGEDTFLDLIARQVLHLRRSHDARLPLVLMNSYRTRDDSLALLARHPELASDVPADFLQHKVPRILAEDLTPVAWPDHPEHEWCPPGHGDVYTALLTSGLLAELRSAGYTHAFVSNSDNLGAVVDADILGWLVAEEIPFLMEVCPRSAAHRKGGHLAHRHAGGLVLRELAQCPEDELDEFQDVERYRYFNTNNLWVDLRALEAELERRSGVLGLPWIRNEKHVDPADPATPRCIQLETAMGAAIEVFPGARAVCVGRERFVPVKTTDDLLGLWSDAYRVTPDFRIESARDPELGDLLVELDPAHYKLIDQLEAHFPSGAPSLARCRRLRVRGDVVFGRGVVAEGDVEIDHPGPAPLRLEDGRVLSGRIA